MTALAYRWSQRKKCRAARWMFWSCTSAYLGSCIWPGAISRRIRQRSSGKFCANLGRSATGTVAMIRQAFGQESVSRTRVFERHVRFRADREEGRQVRSKAKSMLIIFFTSKGLFTKNLPWQPRQSILHTTVIFHVVCVKIWEDFSPNFGDNTNVCRITTKHVLALPFSPGSIWKKTAWLSYPIHPTFLFPRLKIKLKSRHFDTIEVMGAESQEVLNTVTDNDAIKNGRSSGNGAYARKCTTSRVMVPSRPHGGTSPGNDGWLFVCLRLTFILWSGRTREKVGSIWSGRKKETAEMLGGTEKLKGSVEAGYGT
jgi:hypothetical protein